MAFYRAHSIAPGKCLAMQASSLPLSESLSELIQAGLKAAGVNRQPGDLYQLFTLTASDANDRFHERLVVRGKDTWLTMATDNAWPHEVESAKPVAYWRERISSDSAGMAYAQLAGFYERLPQGGYFSPLLTAVLSSSASALQARKRAVYSCTFPGWQRPCCSGRKETINFQLWDMREWKVSTTRSS